MKLPKNFAELTEDNQRSLLMNRGYNVAQVNYALKVSEDGMEFLEGFNNYKRVGKTFKDYCVSKGFDREHSSDLRRIAISSMRDEVEMSGICSAFSALFLVLSSI